MPSVGLSDGFSRLSGGFLAIRVLLKSVLSLRLDMMFVLVSWLFRAILSVWNGDVNIAGILADNFKTQCVRLFVQPFGP